MTHGNGENKGSRRGRDLQLAGFQVVIVVAALATVILLVASSPRSLSADLLLWIAVVACVELLPVPFWRGLQISVGFPILLAAGLQDLGRWDESRQVFAKCVRESNGKANDECVYFATRSK